MAWTSSTPVTVGNPTKKTDIDKVYDNTFFLAGTVHHNLKLAVDGGDVGKLWVYAQSTGALPSATSPIGVLIPDGDELQIRQRTAAYLTGAGSFDLADAAGYWGRASAASSKYTAYLYAIWDGTGIVWALCAYSGINLVPTTVAATDDNYFLLEDSSTYVRNAAHYCVSIAKLEYEYDTADAPDHTINATGFRFVYDRDPADFYFKMTEYSAAIIAMINNANWTAVDAVNARISFIAPRTGKYEVTFNCPVRILSAVATLVNIVGALGLSLDVGATVSGGQIFGLQTGTPAVGESSQLRTSISVSYVFDLAAATSYDFDLYYKLAISGAGGTAHIYVSAATEVLHKTIRELSQTR
jgi:hypothetical protein